MMVVVGFKTDVQAQQSSQQKGCQIHV